MKANEVPETYPVQFRDKIDEYLWKEHHILGGCCSSIEAMKYSVAREVAEKLTEAFIEKALKWYCLDCECNDNCNANHKCFFRQEYKRYLEGNENACPPKFASAILNPDGSTSENWCHRHFIRKMQDAFVEKAKSWFEKQNEWHDINGIKHCDTEDFEDFRKYMKGE